MSNNEKFDALDADVVLRALGPPKRDFRVHKLILSLASPVFRDMFSLPQPTTPTPEEANVADIVSVTDPPHALSIVLKMIYPVTPPSLKGLDTLVECLVIADKYEMQGAMSKLRDSLSRVGDSLRLRVYAIALRFGFTDLAESASRGVLSSVNLTGIPQLPDDFEFVPATVYHKLIRQRAYYLEVVVKVIKQTPLRSTCSECRRGRFTEEAFRLRLAHLVMTGTPVQVPACVEAWVKAYGLNPECEGGCIAKFVQTAISRVAKWSADPGGTPQQRKSILKKA